MLVLTIFLLYLITERCIFILNEGTPKCETDKLEYFQVDDENQQKDSTQMTVKSFNMKVMKDLKEKFNNYKVSYCFYWFR